MHGHRVLALRKLFALAAAVLLLALLPALGAAAESCGESKHPSGKDSCVEAGGSGRRAMPLRTLTTTITAPSAPVAARTSPAATVA